MRVLLAQLAPVRGDVERNLARLHATLSGHECDLAVFPELFLSGYSIGDAFARVALTAGSPAWEELGAIARSACAAVVVGGPVRAPERPGEVYNAALLAHPDGRVEYQVKRYLPTYGPFEEGSFFTPTDASTPRRLGDRVVGLEICYDAFFPEVSRELSLGGAELLVAISAAPVTSRPLFDKVLPARAVENAVPVVYVNRVGVEDGMVFGGGTGAWDPRGEPRPREAVPVGGAAPEEEVTIAEIDLAESARWRRFRPTIRDVHVRPAVAER